MQKINTLLIANRGEIACRIIKTAKRLGLKTIAIYAEPDENALHCHLADESYCVGPLPLEKSYLNINAILNIAEQHADAIHPGYGFLAENAQFAAQCEEKGIIFVGPSSQAIAQMAVKDSAKEIMRQAKVPVVPGSRAQDDHLILKAAQEMGYPIMLKAAKGGGGKGMRLVFHQSQLPDAIESAKRESLKSFGDDTLFIEKYLINARHIEVQIFRDLAGNTVHLFERDCSLQRRHQKIIEETPAYAIELDKNKLYSAAIAAAQAIDYIGAGTIEFLVTPEHEFYFMEMNTRLQVEHPVTEMVTGLDLVEWQLLISDGQLLPLQQNQIQSRGHAIEARIYAEDPYHQFLPTTGTIKEIFLPTQHPYRLDSGMQVGDKITIYFDPLLAKLIVHAKNREEAVLTLQECLKEFHIVGLTTNLPFLRNILASSDFQKGAVHTQYVEHHLNTLLPALIAPGATVLVMACLVVLLTRKQPAINVDEPNSPWHQANAWRLNLPHEETLTLQYQSEEITFTVIHIKQGQYHIQCKAKHLDFKIDASIENKQLNLSFGSHHIMTSFYADETLIEIFYDGNAYLLKPHNQDLIQVKTQADLNHVILAPMPGIISKIWVNAGQKVKSGTKLLALEAMKMELTLSAPKEGLIKSIYFQIGDQVEEGCKLMDFE